MAAAQQASLAKASDTAATEEDTPSSVDRAQQLRQQRQLVAAGAAAGVAAGFNAPLAGVFFALEVVSGAQPVALVGAPTTGVVTPTVPVSTSVREADAASFGISAQDVAELDVKSGEAIPAVVISALVAAATVQEILGNELALRPGVFVARNPLVELPLYVGLGVLSGGVALLFDRSSTLSRNIFDGLGDAVAGVAEGRDGGGGIGATSTADDDAGTREPWSAQLVKPVTGGLACGLIGLAFPQILFFGYSTLDAILATGDAAAADVDANMVAAVSSGLSGGFATAERLQSTGGLSLLNLLFAKLLATSLCVGSGLVGGTFAPSLFFGAVLGVSYQAVCQDVLQLVADGIAAYQTSIGVPVGSWGVIPQLTVADAPAYAMVGAAATLSSVFRAPLTATLLLFELTRGYDIVLPLLAAAGTGPLVKDFVNSRLAMGASEQAGPRAPVLVVSEADSCEPEDIEEAASADECQETYVVMPAECDVDNRIVCEPEASSDDLDEAVQ